MTSGSPATPALAVGECGTDFMGGSTITCTYSLTGDAGGEFTLAVPAGVTSLRTITAAGGSGTNTNDGGASLNVCVRPLTGPGCTV
ncbi:hypothetical protein [Streptomyces erythrochromogenes]|uniref:hypothetical protein n=1 Tax=Streptomyces erythrochromogenes TaxID=285574 RepID=UPI0033DD7A1B